MQAVETCKEWQIQCRICIYIHVLIYIYIHIYIYVHVIYNIHIVNVYIPSKWIILHYPFAVPATCPSKGVVLESTPLSPLRFGSKFIRSSLGKRSIPKSLTGNLG